MRQLYFAPVAAAIVLGCGDSTSPSTQSPNPTLSNLGSMNVGDVRVMTFAQAGSGLTIPNAEAGSYYLIVTANVAGDTGSVPHYTLTGDRSTTSSGLGTSQSLASPVLRPTFTRVGGSRGAQFESHVRGFERSKLPHLVSLAQSRRLGTQSPLLRKDNVPLGVVPTVGSQYQFNVPGSGADVCTSYSTVTATVKAVSQHAIIVTDNAAPSGGFGQTSYDSIANEFDTFIYPTEQGYFGTPTDLDENGHVFILYTAQVNQLTPPGQASISGFVGGFTFAGDLFPNTPEAQGGCPESNEGEIFYLMVPDSTAGGGSTYGNVFSKEFVRQQTRVTMAHELQHAINAGQRLNGTGPFPESAWLDEALSSFGEDAVGRVELGVGDLAKLTLSDMQNMDPNLFSTFFATNFARTQSYVLRPDTIGALVTDARVEQDVAAFGAGWAFLRYVVDWYSSNNARALTTALVAGPDTGTKNLVAHAGAPLDSLLAHWLITMYTDDRPIQLLPAQYNYRSYNMREIVTALCPNDGCSSGSPTYLPVHLIGDGSATITLGIPSSSANYYVDTATVSGSKTIHLFNGGTSTAATYPYGRIYVVRLN